MLYWQDFSFVLALLCVDIGYKQLAHHFTVS